MEQRAGRTIRQMNMQAYSFGSLFAQKKPVRPQTDVLQAFNLILSAMYLMGKTGTRNKGKTYGLPDPNPVFHIKLPYAP